MQTGKPVKHKQVREVLRQQIAAGLYPPGSQLPSEDSHSRDLGVSKITLVRALNDLAREGLIVRRHGRGTFVVDPSSRPLVPGLNLRLGLLIGHSIGANFKHMSVWELDVVNTILQEWGIPPGEPLFSHSDLGTWAEWRADLKGCVFQIIGEAFNVHHQHPSIAHIREARLDGVIALSITNETWLNELLELRIPVVLLDFSYHIQPIHADVVYFDPFPGYQAVVRSFISQGLRRIHFVSGIRPRPFVNSGDQLWNSVEEQLGHDQPDPESVYRKAAWRIEMEAAGLPCDDSQIHATWNITGNSCLKQLARQLADLPPEQRPEAVVCHGLPQAEEFLLEFRRRGYPLQAAGATGGYHQRLGWPIFANYQKMSKIGAKLLLQRITERPDGDLRIGVPLVLPDYLNGARHQR